MNKDLVVYLVLLMCGIVFAVFSLFVLMTSPDYFSILFAAYLLGYSIYMTVHLFRKRAKEETSKIDAAIWVTLFTIFLSVLLAGLAIVMIMHRKRSSSSSGPTLIYQPVPPSSPYSYRSI